MVTLPDEFGLLEHGVDKLLVAATVPVIGVQNPLDVFGADAAVTGCSERVVKVVDDGPADTLDILTAWAVEESRSVMPPVK